MKFATLLALIFGSIPLFAGYAASDTAKPLVSPIFADDMVLQRDQKDPVWGWAPPGQAVTVSINGQSASAVANADGQWRIDLQPPPTGGPYEMVISGPTEVHVKNVMVGDVWLCSGQSNMTMGIGLANNAKEEIAAADYPNLRLYDEEEALSLDPNDLPRGPKWGVCTPQRVNTGRWGGYSAAAYYFGRELQKALNIPVGLIHCSMGGTPIQGWTSESALASATPDFNEVLGQIDSVRAKIKAGSYTYDKDKEEWYKAVGAPEEIASLEFDDTGWSTINLPASQDSSGPNKLPDGTGVYSFRKVIELPPEAAGKSGKLNFGFVKYHDDVRINGHFLGGEISNGARHYGFGDGVLRAGKNVIAVRTFDQGGPAGIFGNANELNLEISGLPTVPLAGEWRYQIGPNIRGSGPPFPPSILNNSQLPSELFNAMINPVIPFGIKGAIWYQGENNAGAAYQYRTLLPTLIADWRARWGEGDFPFLIIQLANFDSGSAGPGESDWAELREAQWLTTQKVPNTGLATAVDIGDPKDIHPKNKQEVGRRFALVARALVYKEQIESTGPIYDSMQVEGNQIRIKFTHADGLKTTENTTPNSGNPGDLPSSTPVPVRGFTIAGDDHHFVTADARIDGQDVLVSSPQVTSPKMVRYDWAKFCVGNLYNQSGLPALPFRTDDLPPVTLKNKN